MNIFLTALRSFRFAPRLFRVFLGLRRPAWRAGNRCVPAFVLCFRGPYDHIIIAKQDTITLEPGRTYTGGMIVILPVFIPPGDGNLV
jgi:hypothetical protein